jgi:D-sedoheptulose 7-phosphate isomerase
VQKNTIPRRRLDGLVRNQLRKSAATLQAVSSDRAIADALIRAAEATAAALKLGGKLLAAGNGGSAADAQHVVAEFVSRFIVDRPALAAVALTVDTSVLTGIGNDYSYDRIFERQIEALGRPGDVFLAISTSGNSPNLLRALQLAKSRRLITIGFSGNGGGSMRALCAHNIIVPCRITMNIQECHLVLEHIFCMIVERCIFGVQFGASAASAETEG